MKRYIRSDEDVAAEGEQLAIDTFGSDRLGPGCTYISPNGTFVNIYPKLKTHEDLCEWVEDKLNTSLPYRDEEYFVREFQWIRLRLDPRMTIIELPSEIPFKNQWYSLQDWLEFVEEQHPEGIQLYLNVCDRSDPSDPYLLGKGYFAEDIINICKRYYNSGKLYMSTEVDNVKRYVKSSYDPTEADTYIVKIWHEVDPGHDVATPEAAEEIFEIVAKSPSDAIEQAKREWSGPIDRIEIVDINPDPDDYEEIPFGASTDIKCSKKPTAVDLACVEMLRKKYGKNGSFTSIAGEDYIGGRGGSVVVFKDGTNAYRVWIDTDANELFHQALRYAWYYDGQEMFDEAHDYKDCKIDGLDAKQIFDTIVKWTDECQADDPHYTLYPGDFDPDEGDIIPVDEYNDVSASTRFPGSGNDREDKCRAKFYTAESYPEVSEKRISDLMKINWHDVVAEDCESFLINEDAFPRLDQITDVRYFNDDEQKWADQNGYDGGYVIYFTNGNVKYAGWNFFGPKMDNWDDVSKEIEDMYYKSGNKAYRDNEAIESFSGSLKDYNDNIAKDAYRAK